MKKNLPFSLLVLFTVIAGLSCNTSYQSQSLQYKTYGIKNTEQKDSSLLTLIKPYGDNVDKSMNVIVGYSEKTLEKKQPEGTLGNFLVDALFIMAAEKYNTKVDIAFLNFGGIRLTQLPAGNVTNGKIFELMPFDNLLILQKLKGEVLLRFLDLTAARGGWPVAGPG